MRRARDGYVRTRQRRPRRWVLGGVLVLLLVVGIDLPLAYARNGHAVQQARSFSLALSRDQREGVPASALSSLRWQLRQVRGELWWSPGYWLQSPLKGVRQASARVWSEAMARGRHRADLYL
ncbi:MAG: hypothetical protein WBF51_00365, partial [Candidatus Dormiibacterota bacterium]